LNFLFADAIKINAPAGRAILRSSRAHRFLPLVFTVRTIKSSHARDQLIIAAFDINGFAVDQGVGNCLPGTLDDSAEGSPGYSHVPAGLLMGQAQQIGQPDSLTLVDSQANLLQIEHGNASGLKVAYFRFKGHPAFFLWSDHEKFLYENILKKDKI
jgi:hypothetical protein